jgi:RNA polymerase sigma-70 factor, ECF subfamily
VTGSTARLPGAAAAADDHELATRLRCGDEAAFASAVAAWSGGMRRLARCFVTTPESADEVVQEAWLGVIEGIDRFEGRSTVKTWAYRILVNTARRRAEREGRSMPWSSMSSDDEGPTVEPERFQGPGEPYPGHWRLFPPPWPSPEEHAQTGELRTVLAAACAGLPDRQRAVLVLRDVDGYGADETCAILGVSATHQRVLLHRARAFVRARLEEYYTSDMDGTGRT